MTTSAAVAVEWPALDWDRQVWDPPAAYGLTRRERAAAGRGYQSAVAAKIAGQELVLPGWLAADLDDATSHVVRFDARSRGRVGALMAVLIRSESVSSSRIEQISASARAIAEAEVTGQGSGNAVAIAGNVRAMAQALSWPGPLDAGRIEEMQASLLAGQSPDLVGWRTGPVWIGSRSSTAVNADYVAPAPERVPDAVDDLVRFILRDDLPVLAQAAIAHAQFETIHPFADGNGRTGRALVHLILRDKGLAPSATIPISSGLLMNRDAYFDALTSYRSGDAGPIISAFCRAAIGAVRQGELLAARIADISDDWRTRVTARSDSAVWRVLDVLPAHPVADAQLLASAIGSDSRNIHRALRQLTDVGILVSGQHYKSRRILFRVPAILAALDEYAEEFWPSAMLSSPAAVLFERAHAVFHAEEVGAQNAALERLSLGELSGGPQLHDAPNEVRRPVGKERARPGGTDQRAG